MSASGQSSFGSCVLKKNRRGFGKLSFEVIWVFVFVMSYNTAFDPVDLATKDALLSFLNCGRFEVFFILDSCDIFSCWGSVSPHTPANTLIQL